jgi:transposase-like protein
MVKCTKCGAENNIKTGFQWRKGKRDVQRYRCKECGKVFVLKDQAEVVK